MHSRRDFCLCCIGTALLPSACGAFASETYRSTLKDGFTPSPLEWAGREWRCNMGSTWNPHMDHCLRLAGDRARFEIRPTPSDRSSNDDGVKLRSELSGSLPGKRERLPYKSVIRHQRSQVRHGEWSRRDASDIDGQSREAE